MLRATPWSLLPPLLLILFALGLTGRVAYPIVNPATALFEFHDDKDKLKNFEEFQEKILADHGQGSSVVELNLDLLESSIKKNTVMPSGRQIQKYNYAVTFEGVIVVAVWKEPQHYNWLNGQQTAYNNFEMDSNWKLAKTSRREQPPDGAPQLVMINIYPEFQTPRASPCWVKLPTGEKRGLLDGSSKHLMLAQGQQVSLHEFRKAWGNAQVRGAGEIIVDLRDGHCAYAITDGSGTYKPFDLDNLGRVAFTFARSLREDDGDPVSPEYIIDDVKGSLTFDKHSTLRGNEKAGALTCP